MDRVGQPVEALTILAIVAAVAAPGWYFSALAIVWSDYVILNDKGISVVAALAVPLYANEESRARVAKAPGRDTHPRLRCQPVREPCRSR
jgi:hypothetical protein